jgi:hypothetical protein
MAIQGTDTATIHTAAILGTIERIRTTATTLGDHTTTDIAITVTTGIITATIAINVM